jgi:histidinol dehydrogenase
MNAIPAKVAGVKRLAITVPTPDNKVNPMVLLAAQLSGVDEVYRVGGAQAIAALAYGTKTIKPVDKITGPGNAFVAAAKRQVFGKVGIDMIAGPSEILVIADKTSRPDWIALDLLSQAEHDENAQSILITDSDDVINAVTEKIEISLQNLSRNEIAGKSWKNNGAIIKVPNFEMAAELSNRIAPEHLELCVSDPENLAKKISNAGAIFLGHWTPEAVGDYVTGPNHVLPTARSARFSSGLSVMDFLKRTTLAKVSRDALLKIGPSAVTLANSEGLECHGLSISERIKSNSE